MVFKNDLPPQRFKSLIAVEDNIEKSMKYNVNTHANIYTHTHIHNYMNVCTHGNTHTHTQNPLMLENNTVFIRNYHFLTKLPNALKISLIKKN